MVERGEAPLGFGAGLRLQDSGHDVARLWRDHQKSHSHTLPSLQPKCDVSRATRERDKLDGTKWNGRKVTLLTGLIYVAIYLMLGWVNSYFLTFCTLNLIPTGERSDVCSSILGGTWPLRSHIWPWQHHCNEQSPKGGTDYGNTSIFFYLSKPQRSLGYKTKCPKNTRCSWNLLY